MATTRIYLGTYTRQKSRGIYFTELDAEAGRLSEPKLAGEVENPTYVAIRADARVLYSANESYGAGGAQVSAFAITPDGTLREINRQSSGGGGACYVAVSRDGRHVLVANYGTGSVAVLPADADGRLGAASAFVQHQGKGQDPKRQEGPHAHCFVFSPDEHFALACDLGTNKVYVYRFDDGRLTENQVVESPPGAGPRHVRFGPGARFAYVIHEMGSSVGVYTWDAAAGRLGPVQTIATVPEGYHGRQWAAELVVHPSGRWAYASERGNNTMVTYAIDAATGHLSQRQNLPSGGKVPRGFAIDPTGQCLVVAHQESDLVAVFHIDPTDGTLSSTGSRIEVGNPVCVKFI